MPPSEIRHSAAQSPFHVGSSVLGRTFCWRCSTMEHPRRDRRKWPSPRRYRHRWRCGDGGRICAGHYRRYDGQVVYVVSPSIFSAIGIAERMPSAGRGFPCLIPAEFEPRFHKSGAGDGEYTPSPASLSQRHWYSSQNRISTVAAWARVAWPWGVRVEPSPVPLMIPAPQAHWRAETAYSDTVKASA